MAKKYGIKEARPKLGDLIEEIRASGQSIVLTRNGKPAAILSPYVEEPMNLTQSPYGILTDYTTGEQLRAATAGEHALSLTRGESGVYRGCFDGYADRWLFVAGGPEESVVVATVNVIDGRIAVLPPDADDFDIYHLGERVLSTYARVEPWGAEELGMDRADVTLANMGWRRVTDWTRDGADGWRANVAPTNQA